MILLIQWHQYKYCYCKGFHKNSLAFFSYKTTLLLVFRYNLKQTVHGPHCPPEQWYRLIHGEGKFY